MQLSDRFFLSLPRGKLEVTRDFKKSRPTPTLVKVLVELTSVKHIYSLFADTVTYHVRSKLDRRPTYLTIIPYTPKLISPCQQPSHNHETNHLQFLPLTPYKITIGHQRFKGLKHTE